MSIDPIRTDVGRTVLFQEYVGGPIVRGVITSYNPTFVYVKFEGEAYAKPIDSAYLNWADDARDR